MCVRAVTVAIATSAAEAHAEVMCIGLKYCCLRYTCISDCCIQEGIPDLVLLLSVFSRHRWFNGFIFSLP